MQPRITYILTNGKPSTEQFAAAAHGTKQAWKLWDSLITRGDVLMVVWFDGTSVTRRWGVENLAVAA